MSSIRSLPTVAALAVVLFASACGKSEPAPATQAAVSEPTKPSEPAKEPTKAPADEPKKEPEAKDPKTAEPKPADPTTAPAGDPGTAPAGDPGTAPAAGDPPPATRAPDPTEKSQTALFPLTSAPGTIVKDPNPESPEGLIQRALLAAMEPDEAKGWAAFEAILHDDQKYGQALTYRREMNFAAMRRKVKLFLFEDPTKPIYKIDRIIEEGDIIRIFVHNKESMPTPCEVRLDATKHWKIGICSL